VSRKRSAEKTVEIHEFYVIRSASGSLPSLCGECFFETSIMVPPDQAAVLAHVTVRMVYRWVESGVVHYKEEPNGSVMVCVKSLPSTGNQIIGV
jgi:hypothetical protein